jgi:hypothetical protein
VTARSSNHSFPDGWLVMLQRLCPVRLQSDRDPEFEHPEHSGGYVLRSEWRERAALRAFVWMDLTAVASPCRAVFSPSVRKSRNLGTRLGEKLMKPKNF